MMETTDTDAARTIIDRVRAKGIKLWASGETLRLTIPEGRTLTDYERRELQELKPIALGLLRAEAWQDAPTQLRKVTEAAQEFVDAYRAAYYPEGRCACIGCVRERETRLDMPREPWKTTFTNLLQDTVFAAFQREDAEQVETCIKEILREAERLRRETDLALGTPDHHRPS